MKKIFHLIRELPPQRRNMIIIASILAIAILANIVLMFRLGAQAGYWQTYVVAVAFIAADIVLILSAVLAGRDHLRAAILLTFISVSSIIVIRTAFLAGMGIMSSVTLFAVLTMLFGQTLASTQNRRALIVAVIVVALNMALDQFASWQRVSIPELIATTPYIAGLVMIILAILTLRQLPNYSLRTKFTLAFSLTAIAVVALAEFISYNSFSAQIVDDFRARVKNAAALAGLQQNGDEFLQISSADDPLYEKFRKQNVKIRNSDPLFAYVYTLKRGPSGFEFVVDAGEPGAEGFSEFGAHYDNPSETLYTNYFVMTEAMADKEIYTDEYGTFLSGYAPISGSDGSRAGVIGVDIKAEEILKAQNQLINQSLLIAFIAGLASVLLGYLFGNLLTTSLAKLEGDTAKFATGNLTSRTSVTGQDEVGSLGRSFNNMADQIQTMVTGLEQRVADRTKALITSSQVSRRLSSVQNEHELVVEVVEQVKSAFNYYYAHIYLLDETNGDLVMVGGTGEAGKTLLARNHKVARGHGLIGRAAETHEAVLVTDTHKDPAWLPNPLLPDTQSELAVPIMVNNQVMGVLDVQNDRVEGLGQQDVEVITSIANQVGIAIQNIRSNETVTQRAAQLQKVSAVSTATARVHEEQELLSTVAHLTQRQFGFYHAHIFTFHPETSELKIAACGWQEGDEHEGTNESNVIQLSAPQSLVARAARTRQAVIINDVRSEPGWLPNPLLPDTAAELATPLIVGDQLLGVLDVQADRINAFTEEDISIQMTLVSQASIALQNARSYELARQQAKRETTLNLISQRIQNATTVEGAMQIAARELGHALGRKPTLVTLDPAVLAGEPQQTAEQA